DGIGRNSVAAAFDQIAFDLAATSPQGVRRSAGAPRARIVAGIARKRGSLGMGVFTLVVISALIALGFWQLQRRVEKHALIAALTERLGTAPVPLPPAGQWSALDSDHDEFRRVT